MSAFLESVTYQTLCFVGAAAIGCVPVSGTRDQFQEVYDCLRNAQKSPPSAGFSVSGLEVSTKPGAIHRLRISGFNNFCAGLCSICIFSSEY